MDDTQPPSIGSTTALTADSGHDDPPTMESAPEESAVENTIELEPATPPVQSEQSNRVVANLRADTNYGTMVGTMVKALLDHHDLSDSYVDARVNTFVPQKRAFANAAEKLAENNVVVLVADADYGRHDTAVALLHGCDGLTYREVHREPGDPVKVDGLETQSGTGWLLDLRGDTRLNHDFGRSLNNYRKRLKDYRSYLVVIVPPELWKLSGLGAEDFVEYLTDRPDARDIIERRLESLEPSVDSAPWINSPELKQKWTTLTPAEAVAWAETIREVQYAPLSLDGDAPEPDLETEFDIRVRMALEAHENYHEDLLKWHTHVDRTARHRNFLVAAAIMEGAAPGVIFSQAVTLALKINEGKPESSGQNGPGIYALAKDIGAELHDGTLRFRRPGYGNAALDFFAVDREYIQAEFLEWLATLPMALTDKNSEATGELIAQRIAAYALRWTLRNGRVDYLFGIAKEWSKRDSLRGLAVQLLTAAALDSTVGKAIRDQLLEWAKPVSTADNALRVVIAMVCAGDVARVYPKLMLYRLAYLAQTGDPKVTTAVKDAIRDLWQKPELREGILVEVNRWCTADDAARRNAGKRTFLSLASLQDLDDDIPSLLLHVQDLSGTRIREESRETLVRGWHELLNDEALTSVCSPIVGAWVASAAFHPELQPLLKETFIAALRPIGDEHWDNRLRARFSDLLFNGANRQSFGDSDELSLLKGTIMELAFDDQHKRGERTVPDEISMGEEIGD